MTGRRWFWPVLLLVACGPGPESSVQSWLLCDECTGQELWQLRRQGDRAVAPLVTALLDGPSAAKIANVRAKARSDFEAAARFRNRVPGLAPGAPVLDSTVYSDASVTGYVNGYRQRALIGLDQIRTPAAIDSIRAVWARDSLAPFPWDSAMHEMMRAYAHGVSEVRLGLIPALTPGQTFQATAPVRARPGTQYVLTWTTGNGALATVSAAGMVTAVAVGNTVVRVCVAGLPAACASTAVRVQ